MPVVLRLDADAQWDFIFPISKVENIQVIITTYSTHRPGISILKGSTSSSVVALPNSVYLDDSDAPDGFISILPREEDVGSDMMIQLSSNSSTYFSFVIRSISNDSNMKVNPLPSSIVLLDGSPQLDRVEEFHENYYVFYVPPGMSDDITISLDPVMVK